MERSQTSPVRRQPPVLPWQPSSGVHGQRCNDGAGRERGAVVTAVALGPSRPRAVRWGT